MKDTNKAAIISGIISGVAGIIIGVNAQKSVDKKAVASHIERINDIASEMSEALKETGSPFKEEVKSEDE